MGKTAAVGKACLNKGRELMKTFSSYHPAVLLVYFLSVILVAVIAKNPVMRVLALGGGFCLCSILERPKEIPRNLAFYIPLFFLIAVITPLFFHNGVTPLFFFNGNAVTLEAVYSGCNTAVLFVAVLYWFQCYQYIMTSDKVLFLLGAAVPKLSLLASAVLRFIPMFQSRFHKVNQSQKAMGLYTSPSYVDKIRGGLRVSSATLTWALEHAIDMGDSMKARGYGLKGRSSFSLFRFTGRDGRYLLIMAALLLVVIIGMIKNIIRFSFYPRISTFPQTPFAWAVYAAFGILCFLPSALEIKEDLKWNYYRSKI